MVEKALIDAQLESTDEIEQIKSSCSKLIDQYDSFVPKEQSKRRSISQQNLQRNTLSYGITYEPL